MVNTAKAALAELELPAGADQPEMAWGSDAVAQALRDLGVEYIALNPGSSFRGLHDSLVNYLGNRTPQMLLVLHEEHAVAMAHGYAKVKGRPMAVALHSNVGLMHATMGVFDAYCDRMPVLMLGATGPLDATARRGWIDWLHTCADQASLVRPYIKWDDQPGSVQAAVDSVLRAHQLAATAPSAPVYVCLDASLQERRLSEPVEMPDAAAFGDPPPPPHPDPESVRRAAELLTAAERPVVLMGRTTRAQEPWDARVELAERLNARVFTHLELPGAFPTAHPCFSSVVPPVKPSDDLLEALAEADVVLSLDWLDLGASLPPEWRVQRTAPVISASVDQHLHNGWVKDHFAPAPADLRLACDPDALVQQLLEVLRAEGGEHSPMALEPEPAPDPATIPLAEDGQLRTAHIAAALRAALDGAPSTLVRVSGAWTGDLWPVADPLDHLGGDGGGGLASGPGITVGAALALKDTGRLPVAVVGDGDMAMGLTSIWTAARYGLPLLIVLANNRSFLNDEMHQHRMADMRDRPVENRWIGQRIDGPALDYATLARGQGGVGFGPVRDLDELRTALEEGIAAARAGAPVVVDVWVTAEPSKPAEGAWLTRPTE
jgi:thiamine pyrophosphate-dependent acetolactate synthase large subunit-like protein